MSGRARSWSALVATALVGLVAAGCGVPLSQSAQMLPKSALPDALAGPGTTMPTTTTTTTTLPAKRSAHEQLAIYLVGSSGHLVRVRRYWNQQITPSIALALLAQGPNAAEKSLTSGIAQSASLRVSISKRGIASVQLDSTFAQLFGAGLYVPLGQIVYTLMANFPDIKGVNFFLHEEGSSLLFNYTPNGTTALQPVTERTYASLAPLPVTTGTKASSHHSSSAPR